MPPRFTDEQQARVTALASDIPALWHAAGTSNADRKEIVRCLVERVTVHVRCDCEVVDVTIRWAGGYESQHEIVRPVATYAQLSDFERLLDRVAELRAAGHVAPEIAATLNAEGFHPPKADGQFTTPIVYQLLKRRALIGNERTHNELLGEHEWWLTDLARELKMSHLKLRDWANRGWVHARRTPVQRRWILWADQDEVRRLRRLLADTTAVATASMLGPVLDCPPMPGHRLVTTVGFASELVGAGRASRPVAAGSGFAFANGIGGTRLSGGYI